MTRADDNSKHDPGAPSGAPPTLEMENISKTFRATRALDAVSFTVHPGEIHGLLGTNGSGKSTLIKILAGFHEPDPGGRMRFNGSPVGLPLDTSDFRRLGMSFVHQNLGLIPSLTVLENLRLSEVALGSYRHIDWRKERLAAQETLDRYEIQVEQWRRIDELSAVNRALIAIARAFEEIRVECERTGLPGLVLLDEPTPFLPKEGVDRLFRLMRQIADHGSSVTFISHDIDEVMEITDRVTILRDGRVSGELKTKEATREIMIEKIIGRTLAETPAPHHEARIFEPFATIDNLQGEGISPCGFSVGKGEVVGLTGLIGSGYDRIPYFLFGATSARSGHLKLAGDEDMALPEMTPARSIESDFALLPGDRQTQSGVGAMTIFENMLLPDIDRYVRGGFLRNGAMRREARRLGEIFEVRPNDPDLNLAALSGGNAQKVLIARWLKRDPRLLLLDEPTQGVDVGTRANIFKAIHEAAANGMSVVCASSDAEQLAELCDRVLVFARGRIVRELKGPEVDKDRIAEACYSSLDVEEDQEAGGQYVADGTMQ